MIDFNDEHDQKYYQAHAIYTYTWKTPGTSIKKKTYTSSSDKISKSGWYLTGYQFSPDEKLESTVSFMGGGQALDRIHFFDQFGKAADKNSKLENNINVYNEALKITNYSNTLLMTKTWSAGQVSMYARHVDGTNTSYFESMLETSDGKSYPRETDPILVAAIKS